MCYLKRAARPGMWLFLLSAPIPGTRSPDGWMDGWMHGCMHVCMFFFFNSMSGNAVVSFVVAHSRVEVNGWMDGWTDGRMDACVDELFFFCWLRLKRNSSGSTGMRSLLLQAPIPGIFLC